MEKWFSAALIWRACLNCPRWFSSTPARQDAFAAPKNALILTWMSRNAWRETSASPKPSCEAAWPTTSARIGRSAMPRRRRLRIRSTTGFSTVTRSRRPYWRAGLMSWSWDQWTGRTIFTTAASISGSRNCDRPSPFSCPVSYSATETSYSSALSKCTTSRPAASASCWSTTPKTCGTPSTWCKTGSRNFATARTEARLARTLPSALDRL